MADGAPRLELARLAWGQLNVERKAFCNVLVKGGHMLDVPLERRDDRYPSALRDSRRGPR